MAPLALAGDDRSSGDSADSGDSTDDGPGESDGSDDDPDQGGPSTDGARSRVEVLVMVASVALTVALFAFVVWNGVAGVDGATPAVTVERAGTTDDGRTLHDVRFSNPGDRGVERATAIVSCGDRPREVTFEHVPPNGHREATVACPAGAGEPGADVVSWQRP